MGSLLYNILLIILIAIYLFFSELRIPGLDFTEYEVRRRANEGDKDFKHDLWLKSRQENLENLFNLSRYFLLISITILLLIKTKAVIVFIFMIFLILLGRISGVIGIFKDLHGKYLRVVKKFLYFPLKLLAPILVNKVHNQEPSHSFYSTEEFLNILDKDSEKLDPLIFSRLSSLLSSKTDKVSELMIKFDKLPLVEASTPLTPVLYNELHAFNLGVALVYRNTPEQLIGIFNLGSSESVSQIRSNITISERMEEHVEVINDTSSIETAVKQLLDGRHSVLVVRNSAGKIVGAISLKQIAAHIYKYKLN